MTDHIVVIISLFFVYFHISGLATTNILRLTLGCSTPIMESKCYCDSCRATIPAHLQLPIVSYIFCKGKCKSCGAQIPIFPLLLELTVLIGMFSITVFLGCTFLAVSFSFLFYEFVRLAIIILKGKRSSQFGKQYIIAILAMIPFYLLTLFVALVYSLV